MGNENKKKTGWKIALIVILALILIGGALVAGWLVFGQDKRDSDDDDDDERAETKTEQRKQDDEDDEKEETEAAPEESPEPSPEPSEPPVAENVRLLQEMGYVGDAEACTMTAAQARACADRIRATQAGVVKAAVFDGGSGVPIIWIAQADSVRSESDDMTVLTGHYQDKIYGFSSGQLAAYDWMTTLLRAGTDGVMVKINRDSTKLQFYHLVNGAYESAPFGVGLWNHSGDATYNGTSIGSGSEVALWDFYRAAGSGFSVLLEAMSGDSVNLYLTGPWHSGSEMCALLDQYAETVA